MFGIFKKKRRKKGIDEIAREKWETAFRRRDEKRFESVSSPDYSAGYIKRGYELHIQKSHCFAWSMNPWFRYYDFVLEADVEFDAENGHSSAGFLLRAIGNEHYYYFLVSNTGYFRFDLVRNEEPQMLIGWTPFPSEKEFSFSVRIIARGDSFTFMINDEWAGYFSDETIDGGRLAFAGQNYGEKEDAVFRLRKFAVNSLPLYVETVYERWNSAFPPDPDARIRLAETLFTQGQYAMAAVQMKKALEAKDAGAQEIFILAECYIKLGLYPEALEALEKALAADPQHLEARLEKGHLLYLTGRYLELREYMQGLVDEYQDRSLVWNLLGHAEFNLGNYDRAAEAYMKASELNPEMPIYLINYAKTLERLEDTAAALKAYLAAADLFFREEAYMDLDSIMPVIDSLDNGNSHVKSVHGKMAFHREEYQKAEQLFSELLEEGCGDSSVYFLYGLCLILRNQREQATEYLYKAAEMEDSYYLYWFRLAENLYLLGLEAGDELGRALDLAPDEPWVCNLAGLLSLKEGQYKEAVDYLSKAHTLLPEEPDIAINLSQAYALSGMYQEAREVLEGYGNTAQVYNQFGNILVEEQRFEDAVKMYDRALRLDPGNPDILFNCGSACLELDLVIRAEELIGLAMEYSPGAFLHIKMSQIARRKGEYYRAEVILEEGRKAFPGDPALFQEYIAMLFLRNKIQEADTLLKNPPDELGGDPEFQELKNRIYKRYYTQYQCSACGRQWEVPVNIPEQSGISFRGRPGDLLPAGKCTGCGKVFCIGCAKEGLEENRFSCLDCGSALKLSEDWITYLLTRNMD